MAFVPEDPSDPYGLKAEREASVQAQADANPNGAIAPITQGQALGLPHGGTGLGEAMRTDAPVPLSPKMVATGKPILNQLGQKIGDEMAPDPSGARYDDQSKTYKPIPGTAGGPPKEKPEDDTPVVGPTNSREMNFQRTDPATGQPLIPPGAIGPPAPGANLRAQSGSVGSGGGFDPFKFRQEALEKSRGHLLDQEIGHTVAKEGMQSAIGAQGDESARYAAEAKTQAAADTKTRADIDRQLKDAVEASKGDPVEQYWQSKNGVQKFAGFLAAAAGGFLQGFRGLASNPGLDAINKDIDRYVSEKHEAHRAGIEGVKSLYTHFLDETKSKNEANALTHAATMDSLGAKVKQAALDADDVEQRAHLMDQYDAIEQQRAEWKDKAAAARAQAAAAAYAAANPSVDKLLERKGKIAGIEKTEAETSKLRGEAGGAAGKNLVNTPDGQQVEAINGEAAQDYTQRMLGADKYEAAVNNIKALREKHGGGTLDPADRKLAEGFAADAKTAYVQMNGFKRTPNETEFQALDKIIPAHGGEYSLSTDAMLGEAGNLAKQARDTANAHLLKPSAPAPTGDSLRQSVATPKPPASFGAIGQ